MVMDKMTLQEVAEIHAGYPFRGRIPRTPGGDSYVVQAGNVDIDEGHGNIGCIARDELATVHLPGRREPDWLREGDLLFLARGRHNFAVYVADLPARTVCAPHFFRLRVRPGFGLEPKFLAWQINAASIQRRLQRAAQGSAQRSIRRAEIEALPVIVPPWPTQERLLQVLDILAEERRVVSGLLANRQRLLHAIEHDLWKQADG